MVWDSGPHVAAATMALRVVAAVIPLAVLSVSLWWYKAGMLLWALWLAALCALLGALPAAAARAKS